MKPMPICSIDFSTVDGVAFRLTPTASRTSALPHLLVTERFPCLAIVTPAPEATKAAVVLTLKLLSRSPPVPHVSTDRPFTCGLMRMACSRITCARAVISSTVSPFILRAARKAPIWAGVASPVIISRMVFCACSDERSFRSARYWMDPLIMVQFP